MHRRILTGISRLDELLGGGLLPGKLTVVVGATGIGKTQLGIQFAHAGQAQEGEPGIIFDMTARGDTQGHADYAERLFNWSLREKSAGEMIHTDEVFDRTSARFDAIHIFNHAGRRVTISDMQLDDWKAWKIDLQQRIQEAIAYFYGNFVHGVRRCVIDGVEPASRPSDSFQFHMFEYIYHQILHKDADWVARDLFRAQFRQHEQQVLQHLYDHSQVACLLLYTCHEMMLDEMIERRIDSGDVLSNANTIILMGKTRTGMQVGRALHVAKHRGSAVDESIVPFEICADGLQLDAG
ncbi:MAG: ATPase domain-containing protein [Planctomycetaceae bacterium]